MIEIKLPRCILALTEAEFMQMLKSNIGIWQQGLKRGKAIQRRRQAAERGIKLGAHPDYH